MRILQVHNAYLQLGGEDRLVQVEAVALRDAGDVVVEAHTSNPSVIADQVRSFPLAPWNPGAARTIDRLITENEPDLAHVHNTWYRWTPSILSAISRRGVPIVMTAHNYRLACANGVLYRDGAPCTDCLGTHPWRAVAHRCYRDSTPQSFLAATTIALNRALGSWSKHVDRFIVANEFASDVLVRSGIGLDRIRIVQPAIPDPGPRLRPPSASDSVVYLGRIDEGKGIDLLLNAWQGVESNLELHVIGAGPMLETFDERRVKRVRFVGWEDHDTAMTTLLSSRALAFPSLFYETLGLSFVEAMAAGLPIIANDLGSRREVIGDSGAAWLTRPGSVEDWEAALSDITDDAKVDVAGGGSRSRYETMYAVPGALARLRAVYRELVSE